MRALLNAFLIAIASTNFMTTTTHALAWSNSFSLRCPQTTRRKWISESIPSMLLFPTTTASLLVVIQHPTSSYAITTEGYDNPNYPSPPEERSGLVILRVAEVAQFQEKILRAILNGDLTDVTVTPQQIVFGTQILLRNSNIAGNMKLMIENDIPVSNQREAAIKAANCMNAIQKVSSTAAKIERSLSPADYEELANLYRLVRVELKSLYDLLPAKEKEKYYGYMVAVTEYEKKIAEGVYNPDIDGVLNFEYDK